ncbi:hypothetical protein BpHYR1_007124 [Brachionus plicatilis]|uniref:SAM domain-containing protein n=1 Tax=Brachionus plicatilis TaxID=10195 RepID=A0A3M7QEG2_BRAPC|nr:hypothetical protein BpHYR1_007124 [Brachionus plicatilis]RNA09593.1 hypothetical protein BpHYR1_007124 [Brachionus plicatilis]
MFRSEVEEWLYSIGLEDLYDSFLEDGFTSLDSVRRMRQSDIDAIVDRRGFMNILNEEIDRLNYGNESLPPVAPVRESASRARSYLDYEPEYEDREKLIFRYESRGIPAVGFASRHLARRAKSTARKTRGTSVGFPSRSSVDRYVPNSASQAFESLIANRRAASVAANLAQELQYQNASAQLLNRQQKRDQERQQRAKTEMQYVANNPDGLSGEVIDRSKFRDHYTNEYVWVERNHITDVGVKYDGLSRAVDHKPSHWRCEDEIERGKEYKRLNDECADKIADNRYSIENSREWLVDNGGVVDRVHRMSAKTLKTRYDLDSIKRNMENLKSMRARLLKN